jgi:hypothetical protein
LTLGIFDISSLMPGVRVELTRPCGRRILSPLRLPFRHPGRVAQHNLILADEFAPTSPTAPHIGLSRVSSKTNRLICKKDTKLPALLRSLTSSLNQSSNSNRSRVACGIAAIRTDPTRAVRHLLPRGAIRSAFLRERQQNEGTDAQVGREHFPSKSHELAESGRGPPKPEPSEANSRDRDSSLD